MTKSKEDQTNYKMLVTGVLCLAWVSIVSYAINRNTDRIRETHKDSILIPKSKTERYVTREIDGTVIMITPTISGGQQLDTLFKGTLR